MRLAAVTLALSLGWLNGPAEAAPVAAGARPIAWRERAFFIPFHVHRPGDAGDAPVEVRLYVSSDGGKTWAHANTADPRVRSFVYRAASDGQYCFSLRTVDHQGRVLPEGPYRTELSVQIDTVAPELKLSGDQGAAGEVHLQWEANDANLDPASLRIDIRCEPDQQWQPLAIGRPPPTTDYRTRSGRAVWPPPPACETVLVRAEVRDRAGNPAVRQARIALAAVADANRGATVQAPSTPGRGPGAADAQRITDRSAGGGQAWPTDGASQLPLGRFLAAAPTRPPPSSLPAHRPTQTGWPVSVRQPSLPHPPVSAAGRDWVAAGPNLGPENHSAATAAALPALVPPALGDQRPGADGINGMRETLAARVHPTLVGSRTFELEYDVSPIDASGIAKVELWGTRDGGRTWTSCGVDDDCSSPMRVHVDEAGIIGFCIVVESGSGRTGDPPAPGTPPEMWVGVDLTRPAAKILGATQRSENSNGDGKGSDQLEIRWEAFDEHLPPRPIALHYSNHAGGPWSMIASALENTGVHMWRPGRRVPEQIYLRLDVHDAAGNTTTVETDQPVALNRPHPTGRIRRVRPVARSAGGAGPLPVN